MHFFFLLSFSFCLCVIANDSLRHLLILNKCNSYSSDHFALAPFNFNTKIKHAPIWYYDANVVVLISHMLNHLMRWRASAIVFVYVYICRNTINIEKEMANCITAVLWLSLPFCLSFFFSFSRNTQAHREHLGAHAGDLKRLINDGGPADFGSSNIHHQHFVFNDPKMNWHNSFPLLWMRSVTFIWHILHCVCMCVFWASKQFLISPHEYYSEQQQQQQQQKNTIEMHFIAKLCIFSPFSFRRVLLMLSRLFLFDFESL